MVGEKYVWSSRLIQASWIWSCTVTETIYTSRTIKLKWNWQNTSHFWQKEFISWALLTYSTSDELYWMNNCSYLKQTLSRMDVLFLVSILRLYPGFKKSFEHNSFRKEIFLNACFCWDSRLFLGELDQKIKFGGTIGYGDSYLEF